MNQKK